MLRNRRLWDVDRMRRICLVEETWGQAIERDIEIGSIGRRNGILLYERLYMPYVIYKNFTDS